MWWSEDMTIYDLHYRGSESKLIFDISSSSWTTEGMYEWLREYHRRVAEGEIKQFKEAIAYCSHDKKAIAGRVWGVASGSVHNGYFFFYVID